MKSAIHIIPDTGNNLIIPSVISLFSDGRYVVGNDALYYEINNHNSMIIKNIKRMVGFRESYVFNDKEFTIPLLISLIIKSVHRNAEEFLGRMINKILISIPADYGHKETEVIKESVKLCSLQIQRIIQESSIAPLNYSQIQQNKNGDLIINIDLGGGTLDLALVSIGDGVYEIVQSLGDKNFGCVDYDYILCDYVINEMQNKYKINHLLRNDSLIYSKILYQAERAKIMFNNMDFVNFNIDYADNTTGNISNYEVIITRKMFSEITDSLNKKIKEMMIKLKEKSTEYEKYYSEKLSCILLTGQGTKIFLIREIIDDVFKSVKIIDQYQENAVVRGLALQSGIMTGVNRGNLLLDLNNIQIEVLCRRIVNDYGLVDNIHCDLICFSNEDSKMYYTLIERKETKPTKMTVFFKFELNDENFEIALYEKSLNCDKRTIFYSISLNPWKDIIYRMDIGVDASNNIELYIWDDKENQIFHKNVFICS